VIVSGTAKALLAYVGPAGDDGDDVDACADPDVLPPLPQPPTASRTSAAIAVLGARNRTPLMADEIFVTACPPRGLNSNPPPHRPTARERHQLGKETVNLPQSISQETFQAWLHM
jgi:hypothetical protein